MRDECHLGRQSFCMLANSLGPQVPLCLEEILGLDGSPQRVGDAVGLKQCPKDKLFPVRNFLRFYPDFDISKLLYFFHAGFLFRAKRRNSN